VFVKDSLHGTGPLSAAGLTAHEQGDDAVLLVPDESLASQSSLVSMAVYPSGQPIAQNVTTLVMPNRLPLDETVAASLLVSPDCDNTTYSVKKLHPLSVDKVCVSITYAECKVVVQIFIQVLSISPEKLSVH